jgi:hypothetical protein
MVLRPGYECGRNGDKGNNTDLTFGKSGSESCAQFLSSSRWPIFSFFVRK